MLPLPLIEHGLNELDSSQYRRGLLCEYQPRSKHLEAWQELKYTNKITYPFDSRIPHAEEVVPTGLCKLKRKDTCFAEFCRLTYGEQLRIFSRTDWKESTVTTWLLMPGEPLPPLPAQLESINQRKADQEDISKWL